MDTTEIIKNALDWADKRLELTDQKLTDEQRNYITFALRQNLVNILPIHNVSNQRELLIDAFNWYRKTSLNVDGYPSEDLADECIKGNL